MAIENISSVAIGLIGPIPDLERPREIESSVLRSIRGDGDKIEARDSLEIRQGRLRTDAISLKESAGRQAILQAQRTINQIAGGTADFIRSELEDIRLLVEEIDTGDFTAQQRLDAQLTIESRIARIDQRVEGSKFSGEKVVTGKPVRIVTDTETGEGFDVEFEDISSAGLGLSEIDVTESDSTESALNIIESATNIIDNLESDIQASNSVIEELGAKTNEEIRSAVMSLQSHELLGAPAESRRMVEESGDGLTVTLQSASLLLEKIDLNTETVAALLKG